LRRFINIVFLRKVVVAVNRKRSACWVPCPPAVSTITWR